MTALDDPSAVPPGSTPAPGSVPDGPGMDDGPDLEDIVGASAPRLRPGLLLAGLAVALVIAGIAAAGIGAYEISPGEIFGSLMHRIGLDIGTVPAGVGDSVLWDIRFPRVVLAALVGASLGGAGAAMQGTFSNPLAEPGIVGVSSGAALGAVASIVLGLTWLGSWSLTAAAFVGGLITVVLVYLASRSNGRTEVVTLILTGIAVNALAGAFIGLFMFFSTDAELRSITFWQLGSVAQATWPKVAAVAPVALVGTALAFWMAPKLDLLSLGERSAAPPRCRRGAAADPDARDRGPADRRRRGGERHHPLRRAGRAPPHPDGRGSGPPHARPRLRPRRRPAAGGGRPRRPHDRPARRDPAGRPHRPGGEPVLLLAPPPHPGQPGRVGVRFGTPLELPARSDVGTPLAAASSLALDLGGHRILDRVDLEVRAGEVLALVGPNGAGKSTLLGALSGDLPASAGEVAVDGRPVGEWGHVEMARRRSVLPQQVSVSFPFRVIDVVRMGRAPWLGTELEAEDDEAVADALARTDVLALAGRRVPTLSGGERARVALARVLAQRAQLMLLDEPTAALDVHHQELVFEVARDRVEQGDGVVVVVHDLGLAAAHADRVAIVADGRLVAVGSPAEVMNPDALSAVYHHDIEVIAHPETGELLVLPRRRRSRS